jgi:A-factor biosynthesis hotdog domain
MTELSEVAGVHRTNPAQQAAPRAAAPRTLEKHLVHKSYDENVLVAHIEAVPAPARQAQVADGEPGRTDHFRGILCVHDGHKFFFEHDAGHVSGLYMIEASRQMSIAVAHVFYKVPFDVEFVMTECSAQFRNVANREDPLLAEMTVSSHAYRKGRLSSVYSEIVIHQRGVEVARLAGTMILLSKQQLQYLEQRGRS